MIVGVANLMAGTVPSIINVDFFDSAGLKSLTPAVLQVGSLEIALHVCKMPMVALGMVRY